MLSLTAITASRFVDRLALQLWHSGFELNFTNHLCSVDLYMPRSISCLVKLVH